MTNKGKLIESVYALELTQRATLVAFYLINRADQENTCFPSVKTIAKECNISPRTVQRALNDLEEAGFLVRESRFHEQGGQRSSLFHLLCINEYAELEEEKTEESTKSDNPINEIQDIFLKNERIKEVDLTAITFEGIRKDILSRSPCQDGIP